MSNLKSTLLCKTWFGFDLDDTLHEFRKASSQASQSIFEAIHTSEGIQIDVLRTTYQNLLRTATANAFTDGRTSTEYRRERFTRLLQAHGVDGDITDKVEPLLNIYISSLRSNIALKPGIMELFRTLRQLEKKIIIVTEGPADAQQWTIEEFGLSSYVDILVTTNEVGKSKVEGLFDIVLEKYRIDAGDIVYFGDNPVRDICAARESGILAILYDEEIDRVPHNLVDLRIDSWKVLRDILYTG